MSIANDLEHLRDSLAHTARMPVVFLGHGSPMNAIEDTEFSRTWSALGRSLPQPTAILVVSAHWMSRGTTLVNVTAKPETIHDFYGFPTRSLPSTTRRLAHELAREVVTLLASHHGRRTTHGASITVLRLLVPLPGSQRRSSVSRST